METKEIPTKDIPPLMIGDFGIKQIYQGDTLLYERKTSYFYIEYKQEGELNG